MQISKNFFLRLFDLANMQRWNDKLRPSQFIEMDKQAHKFMITYLFAKLEEKNKPIDWTEIIEGSMFESLQRLIVTDIKPTIMGQIRQKAPEKAQELDVWTQNEVKQILQPLGSEFVKRYENYAHSGTENISKRILGAAHTYASMWEFKIIERFNPDGYDNDYIRNWFEERMEDYYDLKGIQEVALYKSYKKFIDLCGQLRFQIRWSNLFRPSMTSVLSHSLFVSYASYIFTMLQDGCPERCYNNTFTGLFHDLPEVLTRDIISPVKNSIKGLGEIIKECEMEQMNSIVYPLLPKDLATELKLYTETEFQDYIIKDANIVECSTEEINYSHNKDCYSPRDGKLVKAADELSAFIEADISIKHGSVHQEFAKAKVNIIDKYDRIGNIGKLEIAKLFHSFADN